MDKDSVAYCGMCCDCCDTKQKIGPLARRLYDEMRKTGYKNVAGTMDNFRPFWQYIGDLAERGGCMGCKAGDGNPDCKIRICAIDKEVDNCAVCRVPGCTIIKEAYLRYPCIEDDNDYMRRCGLEAWIVRQERKLREMRDAENESDGDH